MAAHMVKTAVRTARAGSGGILSIRWMSSEPLQDTTRSSHVKNEYNLPDCNALEHVICSETSKGDIQRHWQTYITNFNKDLGHLNNPSFFHAFAAVEESGCEPFRGDLLQAIERKYESMGRPVEPTNGRDQGSGWTWFGLDKKFRRVSVTSTSSRGSLATIGRGRERYMHSDRGMLGTTVLCVRKGDKVLIIGDGQVTLGSEIIKPNVKKVRRIGDNVIGGFAGATADSFTLFERLESKLEEHPGQLTRAAVELAKAWRTDKYLRRLDAVMVVADSEISLTITGNGDVLEPHDGVVGIGSGGSYASAAARALIDLPDMDAETIARKAMKIAADCCIYTNHNWTVEQIAAKQEKSRGAEVQSASLSSATVEETCGKEEQVGT